MMEDHVSQRLLCNCKIGFRGLPLSEVLVVHQQKTIRFGQNGAVRAVRDTPVAAYSAPGINTTRRVAYRPPIAVSPFVLALSVSYFKRTLWRQRPTVTIRRNGFIGHTLASGLQCDGWHCVNLSSRSFYLRAKCNSLCPNYTHHSKSPDLCGYWQSITRSVHLLSCY